MISANLHSFCGGAGGVPKADWSFRLPRFGVAEPAARVYGGKNEIMREIIGRSLGL